MTPSYRTTRDGAFTVQTCTRCNWPLRYRLATPTVRNQLRGHTCQEGRTP
jgi:hypothetical protein